MWAVILDTKATAANSIKHKQATAKRECGRRLWVMHADNIDEFMVAEFVAYCANEGIQRHYFASYSP